MRLVSLVTLLGLCTTPAMAQQWRVIDPPESSSQISETQRALVWTGFYLGGITGTDSTMLESAIERYQRSLGEEPTGLLSVQQQVRLLADADRRKRELGFLTVTDRDLMVQFGYPRSIMTRTEQLDSGKAFVARDGSRFEIFALGRNGRDMIEDLRERSPQDIDFESSIGRQYYMRGRADRFNVHTRIVESHGNIVGYSFRYPAKEMMRYFHVASVIDSSFRPVEGEENFPHDIAPYLETVKRTAIPTETLDPVSFYEKVAPSVYTIVPMMFALREDVDSSQGSAVALTSDYLITNCHVAGDNRWSQFALFQDSVRVGVAKLVALDELNDRCILMRLDGMPFVPVQGVRPYSSLRVGEQVFTIGSPMGFDRSLGAGLISGIRRRDGARWIQTTAPIEQGSSGGGLFDDSGSLIGVTTFFIKSTRFLNFAVAIDEPVGQRSMEPLNAGSRAKR